MGTEDKILIAIVIYCVVTGVLAGLLLLFVRFASRNMDKCPSCGGQTRPYSSKFSICIECGERDNQLS